MNFLIYDEDGRITQSNKVFSWLKDPKNGRTKDHSDVLNELGQQHVAVELAEPLDLTRFYINTDKLPTERPPMPIEIVSRNIRAGSSDAIRLSGIPLNANVKVRARSFPDPIAEVQVTDGSLEVEVPIPGVYVVAIERFPYLDWSTEVEVSS